MRERSRVALAGWYGYGNVGDDLILRLLREQIDPVAVFSTRAGNVGGVTIEHVADLPSWADRIDLLLIGGGGLLNARWIESLPLAEFAKPYGFLSVGVPHAHALAGSRDALEAARFVSVRDHGALALVSDTFPDLRPLWLPDPGFLLARQGVARRPRLLLNPRAIPDGWLRDDDPPDAEERMLSAMGELVGRFWPRAEVLAIAFEERDRRLLERLPCEGKVVADPEAVDLIAGSSALVTARLHGGIIAATQGTPVVLIDYQDKMRGLGELLGRPALPFAELDRLPDLSTAAFDSAVIDPASAVVAYGAFVERVVGMLGRW